MKIVINEIEVVILVTITYIDSIKEVILHSDNILLHF